MRNINIIDITDEVNEKVANSGIGEGVCVVTLDNPHSGLVLLEKDNQDVLDDVVSELEEVFVPRTNYLSNDDPVLISAISKSTLLCASKDIVIENGKLALDDKALYVFNFADKANYTVKCI